MTYRNGDRPLPGAGKPASETDKQAARGKRGKPGWADGLRKLYDDVVAEPLPDSFEDLLKRLDQAGDD